MEGGFLKQPHVLAAETFPGDDGRDTLCVQVGKSEGWLAEAVTGKHVSARSLGRSGIFDEMRQKFTEKGQVTCTHGSGADPMAELGYGDDDAAVSTPRPRKRRRGGPEAELEHDLEKTPSKVGAMAKVIQMQRTASAAAETVDVRVVVRKRSLFLSAQDLPWLFEYLRREMEDGPAIEEDSDDDKISARKSIFWDFHNSCLVAHKKTADGELLVKKGPIERRMRTVGDALHGLTRDEAKRAVHDELRGWLSEPEAAPVLCVASADAAFS